MEFSKEKIRQIRNLMLLGTALILMLLYSREIFGMLQYAIEIVKPFLYGSVIAFVLNLPMKMMEDKLLYRWQGRKAQKLKRPASIFLSVLLITFLLSVSIGMVFPQLTSSVAEIGKNIPAFMEQMVSKLENFSEWNRTLNEQIGSLQLTEINWDNLIETITKILKNGAAGMLNSTFSIAGNLVSVVTDWAIAFVFALYILIQKEKLQDQCIRILTAYLSEKIAGRVQKVCSLLYQNFSKFVTGRCLEAVILGTMFVICMSIFRLPYPLVIGMLIAMTSLIPVVGAIFGCIIGAFLILMESPLKAFWFVILFLVLQQIEGNLIYPKVVGNSVGLPPMWVLVAISVGGSLFGIAGMLLFIPLMSTFYTLLKEDVNKRNHCKKQSDIQKEVCNEIINE
jgi:predicted PurR-regulated permease PerM